METNKIKQELIRNVDEIIMGFIIDDCDPEELGDLMLLVKIANNHPNPKIQDLAKNKYAIA